jgi:hypothetical protein
MDWMSTITHLGYFMMAVLFMFGFLPVPESTPEETGVGFGIREKSGTGDRKNS